MSKHLSSQALQVHTGEEARKIKMLQRIYGTAFPKKAELEEYLTCWKKRKNVITENLERTGTFYDER